MITYYMGFISALQPLCKNALFLWKWTLDLSPSCSETIILRDSDANSYYKNKWTESLFTWTLFSCIFK